MSDCEAKKPEQVKYEPNVIKKMIGRALAEVPGVLGTDGNILSNIKDAFSSDEDNEFTRGVSIKEKDSEIEINIKLITEFGKNIPEITESINEKVSQALCSMGGISVKELFVDVVDSLSPEEYKEKYKAANKEGNESNE